MGLQLEGTVPTPLALPGPSRQLLLLDSHGAVVDRTTRTISVHPHTHTHRTAKSASSGNLETQRRDRDRRSSSRSHAHARVHTGSGAKSDAARDHSNRDRERAKRSSRSSKGGAKAPVVPRRAKTPPAVLSSAAAAAGERDHSSQSSHKRRQRDRDRESLSKPSPPRAAARVGEPPAPIALVFGTGTTTGANSSPKAGRHPSMVSKSRLIVQTSPVFSRPIVGPSAHATASSLTLTPPQSGNIYTPTRGGGAAAASSSSLSLFSSPPLSAPPRASSSAPLPKHFDFCCVSHSPEHTHASLPSPGTGGLPSFGGAAPRTPRARGFPPSPSEGTGSGDPQAPGPDFAVFHLRHAQLRHTFASIVRQQRAKFTRRLSHNDAFIKQRRLKQAPVNLDVCLLGPQNSGVTSVLNSFVRDGTLFGTPNRQDATPPNGAAKASPPSAPISPLTPLPSLRRRRASSSIRKSPTLPQRRQSSAAATASSSPNASPILSGMSAYPEPPLTRRCVSDGGASVSQQQPPPHRRRPSLSFLKKGASTIGGSLRNLHKGANGGSVDVPMSPLGALPPPKGGGGNKDDGSSVSVVSVTFENVPYILKLRAMSKLPSTLPSCSEQRATLHRIKVFILCFSIEGGDNALEKVLSTWVPEIRAHCSKVVPVLVVGTHSRRRPSIPGGTGSPPKMPSPTAAEAISDAECRRQLLKLNDPNVIFCGHSNLQGSSGANGVNSVFRQASAHGRRYSKEYAHALSLKEIEEASSLHEKPPPETKLSGIKEKLRARARRRRQHHRKDRNGFGFGSGSHSSSSSSSKAVATSSDASEGSSIPMKRGRSVGDSDMTGGLSSSTEDGSAPSSLSTTSASDNVVARTGGADEDDSALPKMQRADCVLM